MPLAATLNDVAAAPPPELDENTHVPVELTPNASAKLDDEWSTVSVNAADDHVLINKVPEIGPPDSAACAACTTMLDDVVTVTPLSCAPTAVSVTPLLAAEHST